MANEDTLKSVWATVDDFCINAMKLENETTAGSKLSSSWASWQKSRNHPEISAEGRNKLKPESSFSAKGTILDGSKNKSNSETLGDFEAIPAEFRPNKSAENLFPIRAKPVGDASRVIKPMREEPNQPNRRLFPENNFGKTPDARKNQMKTTISQNENSRCNSLPENIKLDALESKLQPKSSKPNLFFAASEADRGQKKGNVFNNNQMRKKSQFKDCKRSQQIPDRRKKELHVQFYEKSTICSSREDLKNTGTKGVIHQSTKVTKFHFISPEHNMRSKKIVQTWESSNVATEPKNTRGNRPVTDRDALKTTTGKVAGKRMIWMENLCTVKKDSEEKKSFEYISSETSEYVNDKQQQKNKYFLNRNPVENNNVRFKKHFRSKGRARKPKAHTEEFVIDEHWNSSTRKFERNNVSTNYLKKEIPVMRHEIKIIHVNEPGKSRGKKGQFETNKNHSGILHTLSSPTTATYNERSSDHELSWNRIIPETKEIQEKSSRRKTTDVKEFNSKRPEFDASEEKTRDLFASKLSIKTNENKNEFPLTTKASYLESPHLTVEDNLKCKSLLIHYGEEISDTIVGSYTAMNLFLSFYKEWKELRVKTIVSLEELANNLSNSTKRNDKIKDVVEMFGAGGRLVAAIPDPRVSIAGRIVAALSEVIAKLFSSAPGLQNMDTNEFELMLCLQQDIDATSEMYMYGLQCDQQFQETCSFIKEFHSNIEDRRFKDVTKKSDIEFLEDMSQLNPKSHIVYYRRLQKWLERLKENQASDVGKAFCRAFRDWPEAIETITLLHWRFHAQGLDSTVTLRGWEEIMQLLQSGNSVTATDILPKIQNSLLVLMKERRAMERDVMELLKHEK